MWTQDELRILEALDTAVRSEAAAAHINEIVSLVEQELQRRPDDVLAWKSIPLTVYGSPLPAMIRSSWAFILRANTITGAERHPNSHQRMMSYRGRAVCIEKTAIPDRITSYTTPVGPSVVILFKPSQITG